MPQRVRRRVRQRRRRSPPGERPGLPPLRRPRACDRAALARPELVGVQRPAARRRGPGTAQRVARAAAPSAATRRGPRGFGAAAARCAAARSSRVDHQRPLADVAPAQRERLLRPQPRVREHRDQRRVPRDRSPRASPRPSPAPAAAPRAFGGRRALRTSRTGLRAIRSDSSARCRMLPSSVSALSTDDAPGAGRDPLGLPARDHLRRQLDQLQVPEVRRDVQVVQRRVDLRRARRQRHRVRRRPRLASRTRPASPASRSRSPSSPSRRRRRSSSSKRRASRLAVERPRPRRATRDHHHASAPATRPTRPRARSRCTLTARLLRTSAAARRPAPARAAPPRAPDAAPPPAPAAADRVRRLAAATQASTSSRRIRGRCPT